MLEDIQHYKRLSASLQETRLSPQSADWSGYRFYRIHRVSISDELDLNEIQSHVNKSIQQFIGSLSGRRSPVIYRIVGSSRDRTIALYIGEKSESGISIAERFTSYFQGVEYTEFNGELNLSEYKAQTLITGIPAKNETNIFQYNEQLVRMIRGRDVMLEIESVPVNSSAVIRQLNNVIAQRTKNSEFLKMSRSDSTAQSETFTSSHGETMTDGRNNGGNLILVNSGSTTSEGTTSSNTDTKGTTDTRTTNMERSNFEAVELEHLLEIYTERLQEALSSGLWRTSVTIFSRDINDIGTFSDIYKSAFSIGAIEPYQSFNLSGRVKRLEWKEEYQTSQPLDIFHEQFREYSFLNSIELSYLLDIPKEEYNGYIFTSAPRFNQNQYTEKGLSLGRIYDGDDLTPTSFHLDPNQLVKHLLVAGITGSGKTNTIFNLLRSVGVPFLIIEPAKKEYRALSRFHPELRVYTLGNESVSPLRINPFYFPASVNIQQHIDNLKVIFNASFTMYASMPNILEQCITNVYMKKGWSLTTSRNIYQRDQQHEQYYFPTVEDLYHEIDSYTKELGYAQEQMQNIRAALLTRIKSLMTGGKGWMLNTVETMDIRELLRLPTVLELEAIADDDEKSLVIGLISMFIYEYLKSEETEFSGSLKHLLVLEEAHRIFANVNQHGSQEDVNIKGKAVESLSHILSEIRAYGEGMIIVDQVPTKLAPDVLKNTNTKIIHRIVSRDDCEYVGNSLGLIDEKLPFISKLKNGAALLFTDGMHAPVHLQIHHGKENVRYIPDSEIADRGKSYNSLLHATKQMHPLTELIIQNMSAYPKMMKEAEECYRILLKEDLEKLHSNYGKSKEIIISKAGEYGFDMDIDVDDFVFSFIREGLLQLVKSNEKINKQINKRISLEKYIESALGLLTKEFDTHFKEYRLLEINQRRLGGEYDV